MYKRLLNFLRCPECGETLELTPLVNEPASRGDEVSEGLLGCARGHWFPVVRGIPRMLPDSLEEHWPAIKDYIPEPVPEALGALVKARGQRGREVDYDRGTRQNFSLEWDNHDLGGRTWGMRLDERVDAFFKRPVRLPAEELAGKVMLDAGCGNGSQSVAYTALGLEVIAVDLSSGLEHGHKFRLLYEGAKPENVHFVQADLQHPPLRPASVDIIHSAGVLHHTPDTLETFRALRPLLRPGGTFYIWLYKYEQYVTPVVNSMRVVTTRIPSSIFAGIAGLMTLPFRAFCATVDALGIRKYSSMSNREASIALMDIFGAPYAHYHSYDEVAGWFKDEGFEEYWPCNNSRRGFGVCGRLAASAARPSPVEIDEENEGKPLLAAHAERKA